MLTRGPTTGAVEHQGWSARPWLARTVRALTFVFPIAVSFATTGLAGPTLYRPPGWWGLGIYLLQAIVVGASAALLAGRVALRAVPLAALLNMTLVFPDQAPSRFSIALRTGTVRQLKRSLVEGTLTWPEDRQQAAEQLISLVNELGRHERLTRGHTERVRAYADLIGEELGLDAEQRELLHWGALVHDIGKLAIPPGILNKQGRPDSDEWALLQTHPSVGGGMLEPLAGWLGQWRLAASQHHERFDGTGYPAGLAGSQISLAGRIVAVADAFDVITSTRSYKQAMSHEAARQEMVRCAGTQFDPDVVRALLSASLTKNRPALGFLGALADLRVLSSIPQAASQGAATAATALAVVTGAVAAPVVEADPPPQALAFEWATPEPVKSPTGPLSTTTTITTESTTTTDGATTTNETTTNETTTNETTTNEATTNEATTKKAETTISESTTTTARSTTDAPMTTTAQTTTAPTITAAPTATTAAPTTITTTALAGPTARPDTATVQAGWWVAVDVIANDLPGSAPLDPDSLRVVADAAHGWSFPSDLSGRLVYWASDKTGTTQVTYEICDDNGQCGTSTLTVEVT